ncbi:MAG: hypothetical protein ACKO8U_18145, partial [Pirellula sp.]
MFIIHYQNVEIAYVQFLEFADAEVSIRTFELGPSEVGRQMHHPSRIASTLRRQFYRKRNCVSKSRTVTTARPLGPECVHVLDEDCCQDCSSLRRRTTTITEWPPKKSPC